MKRQDAFRKLRLICQRLDEVDLEQFFVLPRRLYLLGSLLTDKPNPSDVDLLFEYRDRPDLDPVDIVRRLSYGKSLPHEQAITHLGMVHRGRKTPLHFFEKWEQPIRFWHPKHCFLP